MIYNSSELAALQDRVLELPTGTVTSDASSDATGQSRGPTSMFTARKYCVRASRFLPAYKQV